MNPYYHSFSISFSWWMIIGVLSMAFIAFCGWKFYYVNAKNEVRELNPKVFRILMGLMTGVFTVFLAVESHRGILQMLRNQLSASDSVFWADIMLGFAILAAAVIMYGVLYGVFSVAAELKFKTLHYRENAHRKATDRVRRAREIAQNQNNSKPVKAQ